MSDIRISIEDWIKEYTSGELDDFAVIKSCNAWEEFPRNRKGHDITHFRHGGYRVDNAVFAFHIKNGEAADKDLIEKMTDTILAAAKVARATKLEGYSVGWGELVLVDRMDITLSDRRNWPEQEGEPERAIIWYGALARVGK